jgi:glycosyltransferase involved in cell wall biosynthesis
MNGPNPQHTFVIPAFGQSQYLEDCIKSLLQQTTPSHIIITTSTPNAHISTIAEKYQIPVFINANGGSIGKDWNFAFATATTPYVTLAHQDDTYMPTFAEQCIKMAEKNISTTPLFVFTQSVINKDGKQAAFNFKNILRWLLISPFHFKKCIQSKSIKKSVLLFSNSISCPGVFYVKQNLPHLKFDESAKYILDWKAWYDMSQMQGSFIYIPHALHLHREHKESATSITQLATLQQEEFELLTTIWGNTFIPRIITKLLLLAK